MNERIWRLSGCLATALLLLSGCDSGPSQQDLGNVVEFMPQVPGADKPYRLPSQLSSEQAAPPGESLPVEDKQETGDTAQQPAPASTNEMP